MSAAGLQPCGQYKTKAITATLSTSGLCATAPLNSPTNGRHLRNYVTETLVPVSTLGDIVIMTSCQPTRSRACKTRSRLQERGCSISRPTALISV